MIVRLSREVKASTRQRVYNLLRKPWFASFVCKLEVLMHVHVSYRFHKTPALGKQFQHHVEKLCKRMRVFRSELVRLEGMVEELSSRQGIFVSLNLRLPAGQMFAQVKASNAETAMNSAFGDLMEQLNQRNKLLSVRKWPRRQKDSAARRNRSAPVEQTVATVFPGTVSSDDVRSYVNANLVRLERFVEREIYFRESSGLLAVECISKEEVIDETIAVALGDNYEKPERLSLEPWLYHLAMRSLDQLCRSEKSNDTAVHLEDSVRKQNVKASDEPNCSSINPTKP